MIIFGACRHVHDLRETETGGRRVNEPLAYRMIKEQLDVNEDPSASIYKLSDDREDVEVEQNSTRVIFRLSVTTYRGHANGHGEQSAALGSSPPARLP
jgi:hypothetical protein